MHKTPQNILADKHAFIAPDEHEFECLEQCLAKRIQEGQGECFLEIGCGEGQEPGLCLADCSASVATAEALAQRLNSRLILLRDRFVQSTTGKLDSHPPNPNGENLSPPTLDHPSNVACIEKDNVSNTFSTVAPTASSKQTKRKRKATAPTVDEISSTSPSPVCIPTATDIPLSPDSSFHSSAANNGFVVKEFLLRRNTQDRDFVDVRVAVVGNVDAGKSTMLGVLTHGELDNGRGLARLRLFRHKHEIESGRTSSVSNDILGFDANGVVVNRPVHGKLDWSQICQNSAKVITFIDLAGHERYLKTTVFGLTGHAPDFVMLMIGANAGVIGMTKEHLGLALALSVPVFVVISKIDMCPPDVLNETINLLFRILKSPGCRKIPAMVSTMDDVVCSAINFTSERMCPVFLVSNVNGSNLDLLTAFLNLLAPRSSPHIDEPAEFQIDELFTVPGVGAVVSGTCLSGIIRINDVLLLGPDSSSKFIPVPVKSIQRKRMTVTQIQGGQTASFSLKRPKGSQLRRGMVLVSKTLDAFGCMEFLATVLILHHPTTITIGYQAMVHTGPVRQTATILTISGRDCLRTGDKAEVRFRFIKHPEYLRKGVRLVFREGKTKAVGTVNEAFPYQPVATAPVGVSGRRAAQQPAKHTPSAGNIADSHAIAAVMPLITPSSSNPTKSEYAEEKSSASGARSDK